MIDFEDMLWVLECKLRKMFIEGSTNTRPSSEPYVSGDTFRGIADHVYEKPTCTIAVAEIKEKDIVFVESTLLDTFFNTIHPQIKNPYILISHNSDENITEKYVEYIDEKIIHWFAQNLMITHPKITPIPIGLENLHHANAGVTRFYQENSLDISTIKEGRIDDVREARKSRVLYTFNVATNPNERSEALKVLKECDFADKLNRGVFVSQPAYVRVLRSYLFVASPPGGGEDCHRTWEALYSATVPIVKLSPMTKQFIELGVPLFAVAEWSELEHMSKYELIAKYDLIWQHGNVDTLYFDFWKDLILGYKNDK